MTCWKTIESNKLRIPEVKKLELNDNMSVTLSYDPGKNEWPMVLEINLGTQCITKNWHLLTEERTPPDPFDRWEHMQAVSEALVLRHLEKLSKTILGPIQELKD